MKGLIVALLAASVAVIGIGPSASAQEAGCVWVDPPGKLVCNISDNGPGGPGAQPVRSTGSSLGFWQSSPAVGGDGFRLVCDPETGEQTFEHTSGPEHTGSVIRVEFISAGNGAVLVSNQVCVGPNEQPPLPPDPPSAADIWSAAGAPGGELQINPEIRGLTGLETWLWGEPYGPIVVGPLTLGGYTVTGTAEPVEWSWDTGDGETVSAPTAGSEENPAVSHVYETKGFYGISHSVTWQGTFTVTGFGLNFAVDAGTYTPPPQTITYEVIEARSVLSG